MQAKLEPNELAYLLQLLKAEKVVGVNNAQLFPDDPATRDALLKRGFTTLQEHGWLVAEENGMNANNRLMLMVAVLANPDYTLSAVHYASTTAHQTLTYYLSEGIVVEQFVAPDGDYVLGQLTTIAELVTRVREVFSPVLTVVPDQRRFIVTADMFELGMAQAKSGDLNVLQLALLVNDLPQAELATLAATLRQLHAVGRIEGAAIAGRQLQAWHELAILRSPDHATWLVQQASEANTIEFVPASDDQFDRMLDALLTLLRVAAV